MAQGNEAEHASHPSSRMGYSAYVATAPRRPTGQAVARRGSASARADIGCRVVIHCDKYDMRAGTQAVIVRSGGFRRGENHTKWILDNGRWIQIANEGKDWSVARWPPPPPPLPAPPQNNGEYFCTICKVKVIITGVGLKCAVLGADCHSTELAPFSCWWRPIY